MDLSRSRTLYLILCLALIALSLRPQTKVDGALEWLFAPTRVLAELTRPLHWMSLRSVRAAQAAIEDRADAERAASLALLSAEQAWALPTDPALRVGRGLIHAQVVEPGIDVEESIVIRFAPDAEVAVGMPVVCRDTYVGRIARLEPYVRGEATVALVTGSAFRVGARADATAPSTGVAVPRAGTPPLADASAMSGPCELVVGGIAARPEEDPTGLYLAAHVPSLRSVRSGRVRVAEIDAVDVDPYARLADGFGLGRLASYRVRAVPVLALRAELDYTGGLSQVVVLCPAGRATPAPELLQGRFGEENWIDADLALSGDPSFWREGRKLNAGSADGVAVRSVLALGARFVGLVARVGRFTSDVELIGDPGLALSVLARVADGAGGTRPLALGRMVSVGCDRSDGALMLRWDVAVSPFDGDVGDAPVEALLFTGSGERDVPPGLVIGTTSLPRGCGSAVLRVRTPDPLAGLARVRVLCAPRAETRP